jgi:hypothetical protein
LIALAASYARKSISFNTKDMKERIRMLSVKQRQAVIEVLKNDANEMTNYAKSNAPWTDRTGNARANLHSYVTELKNGLFRVTLSHGVYYGIYLEYYYEGRFSIILPTIEVYSPEIMKSFTGLLDKLGV